ncbi:MAG: hypothetical protein ACR2RE_15985 [Geminicoccaceae bacterium]
MTADGPASANIHTASGIIEVEVPVGRSVEIKIMGSVAVVTYH